MRLIEKFIKGKVDEHQCEDSYYINDYFACVIDGSTRQTNYLYDDNLTPGKLASILIKNAVSQLNFKSSLEEAVQFLTDTLYDYYQQRGNILDCAANKLICAAASVVLYSDFYSEIWMIGDCQCYVSGKSYNNYNNIDRLAARIRSIYLSMELEKGVSLEDLLVHDSGREYILPILKNQVLFQNKTEHHKLSYSSIDGFPVDMARIKKVHVKRGSQIVLASDGYPRIFKTLDRTERYLRYILEKDPLIMRLYMSTKGLYQRCQSYDDRAYLSFQID